jgi:hypothetical protein
VELVAGDRYVSQLGVGHLDAPWIKTFIQTGPTLRPVLVVVLAIRFTTTSWLARGRPRQFIEMAENSRCSMRFHLDVPEGR